MPGGIVHVDKNHTIRGKAQETLPPLLFGSVHMVLAQLFGRKENRSVLRLWLSWGAYSLTVNQSSWGCIASTSWGLGTVDSSIFLYECAYLDVCRLTTMHVQVNVRCKVREPAPYTPWPPLIFDILWPCMADQHQLVLQRKNNNLSLLKSSAHHRPLHSGLEDTAHVIPNLSLHIQSRSWESMLTSVPGTTVYPLKCSICLHYGNIWQWRYDECAEQMSYGSLVLFLHLYFPLLPLSTICSVMSQCFGSWLPSACGCVEENASVCVGTHSCAVIICLFPCETHRHFKGCSVSLSNQGLSL